MTDTARILQLVADAWEKSHKVLPGGMGGMSFPGCLREAARSAGGDPLCLFPCSLCGAATHNGFACAFYKNPPAPTPTRPTRGEEAADTTARFERCEFCVEGLRCDGEKMCQRKKFGITNDAESPTSQDAAHVPPNDKGLSEDEAAHVLHKFRHAHAGAESGLKGCPFCGARMIKRERSAFHPEDDCWLGSAGDFGGGYELSEHLYRAWNTRTLSPVQGDAETRRLIEKLYVLSNIKRLDVKERGWCGEAAVMLDSLMWGNADLRQGLEKAAAEKLARLTTGTWTEAIEAAARWHEQEAGECEDSRGVTEWDRKMDARDTIMHRRAATAIRALTHPSTRGDRG